MDEISREPLADTTTSRVVEDQEKGPRELLLHERAQLQEDLVVNPEEQEPDPAAADSAPGDSAAGDSAAGDSAAGDSAAGDSEAGDSEAGDSEVGPSLWAERLRQLDAQPVADAAAEPDHVEGAEEEIAPELAAGAVAEAAGTAEISEDVGTDEDGLPAVPEITDAAELSRQIFVLMLSSREGLTMLRLAQACNTTQKLVEEAIALLEQQLQGIGLPIELSRNGESVKWLAKASTFPFLQRLRGVKKLEKLSPAALETLAVVAYRQPVMRSEIEAIRGVKAGPMLRTLLHHKLVRVTGRADVPGRPLQYGTTQHFLERFGLSSLQELPSMKEWENLG